MLNATRLLINYSSKYSIIGYLKKGQFLSSNNFYSTTKEALTDQNQNQKLEITISDNCVKRLKQIQDKNNKFLRISVESGGCSGFEYKFSLDNKIEDSQDRVFEKDSAKIIVDQETLNFIKGSTIDYFEELIRAGFRVVNNPSADHGCSCGSSFSVKI